MASSPQGEVPDPRLSDKRLRFDLLDQADLELKLIAGKIEGERIRTEGLELFVDLDNGRLKAHHKELKHQYGTVSSSLEVNNTVDPTKVAFKGRGNNISLGALHAQVSDNPRLLEGMFSFDVDMVSRGRPPHEIFATTNGRYGHVMEDSKLTGRDLDILAFDFLELLTATVVSKGHTTIDCAIAEFEVNDGIATSDTLYVHTPKMLATGVGKLDFRQDTLDIVVNTKAKRTLIRKRLVLRVHGPMQNPKVSTDLSPEAIAAAVAGKAGVLALPSLGFSMTGLSFLGGFLHDSKKAPCIPGQASAATTGGG